MIKCLVCIVGLFVSTSLLGQQLGYMVSGIYTRSIIKTDLSQVQTLSDINVGFPSSWIAKYLSVDIQVSVNDETRTVSNAAHTLSKAQKEMLSAAKMSSEVSILVSYEPKGEPGEIKEIRNSFTVIPKYEAKFSSGRTALDQYIEDHIIQELSQYDTASLTRAVVQFTVDTDGSLTDINITSTTGNMMMDHILINALENMERWTPAKDAEGNVLQQKLELSVGNELGC